MTFQEKASVLFFMLAVVGVYGLEAVLLVGGIAGKGRERATKSILLAKPVIVLHVAATAGVLCMLYGYFVEPYWLDIHTETIRTAKLASGRIRIVQISDLHCDRKVRNEEKIIAVINRLKPDVIVATGDFLNCAEALPRLQRTLSELEAPLGKFAVEGNFEVAHGRHFDMLENTGFRLLRQDAVVVAKDGDEIGISGLSMDRAHACRDMLADLPDDRFNAFLFHTPDLIEDICDLNVDLYLCGHTHGGQVTLPFYGALITFSRFGKKYESGKYCCGDTVLYVNRGLGLEPSPAPQVRFCARPEITVFDIAPQEEPP
jgi:predicted MPP superfamily phosphohydrolase